MQKVAVIGVMGVFLAILLKKERGEFAMLVIMGACLLIASLALDKIQDILALFRRLKGYMEDGNIYLSILLKMVGITYVAEFGSNLCRDAGYQAVAEQITFYGKLMILAVSIPIMTTLLDTLENFW